MNDANAKVKTVDGSAYMPLLSVTAASVEWVTQYKDDMGRWKDKGVTHATDEECGIDNVNYSRKQQPGMAFRLIKRFVFDSLVCG